MKTDSSHAGPSLPLFLFYPLMLLILGLAYYLRAEGIESRPLHSDESVNFLFIEGLFRDGIYPYSHENYHGPLYFFLMGLGIKSFNDSVLGVRLAAVVTGTLLILGVLPLRRYLGTPLVLVSAFFLAIAPSFVFHSRYAIHETLLVAASLYFASTCFLLWTKGLKSSAVVVPLAASVMLSTKETWVIAAASVAVGLLFTGECNAGLSWKEKFLSIAPWMRIERAREQLFLGYVLGLIVLVLSFSNGLKSGNGLHEFFMALPQWIGRGSGDVGHFKPFDYYVKKLIQTAEPNLNIGFGLSFLLGIAGSFFPQIFPARRDRELSLGYFRFLFAWSLFSVAVYSFIPYKTPWLIINLTLPLVLIQAWTIATLFESPLIAIKVVGVIAFAITSLTFSKNTARFCYSDSSVIPEIIGSKEHLPYGEANPYSYVHTDPGMLRLIADLNAYWESHPNARVLIGVDGYFPLPYYLRKHASQLAYLKTKDPQAWKDQYDVILVDQTVKYADPNFEMKYYRLSDYGESNTYFKKTLPQQTAPTVATP